MVGGCILGQRDAIQPCPLSRTLDESPSLHSGEHLFCVGSFKPAGFWLGERRPHPTSRPAAPPKASTSARPRCRCTQEAQTDTHKCGFALDRGWKCADLPTLPVTICCANAERENGTNTFFLLFLSRLFLFSKRITIVYFYTKLLH